jgi:hypothetical protein
VVWRGSSPLPPEGIAQLPSASRRARKVFNGIFLRPGLIPVSDARSGTAWRDQDVLSAKRDREPGELSVDDASGRLPTPTCGRDPVDHPVDF